MLNKRFFNDDLIGMKTDFLKDLNCDFMNVTARQVASQKDFVD